MVAVRMRVDEHRHRVGCQFPDLVENRLSPSRVLRVDDDDAVGRDEGRGIPAAAAEQVEVVPHLGHADLLLSPTPLQGRQAHRQGPYCYQHSKYDNSSHHRPPRNLMRSTNQNPPATTTVSEPANTILWPRTSLLERSAAMTIATDATTMS